ncbi:MAG: hypothetical protein FWC72_04805, partial [Oscillospiraceae bacterium]|nr:hypothetical protein [Oscillospiraceae bacterium]
MKKYLLLLLAIMLLLTLAACDGGTVATPTATPEPVSEETSASILGLWVYVKSTEGEPGTPLFIYEFELSPPHLEIRGDNTT